MLPCCLRLFQTLYSELKFIVQTNNKTKIKKSFKERRVIFHTHFSLQNSCKSYGLVATSTICFFIIFSRVYGIWKSDFLCVLAYQLHRDIVDNNNKTNWHSSKKKFKTVWFTKIKFVKTSQKPVVIPQWISEYQKQLF